VVRYLLSKVPDSAAVMSKKRKLALHFACGDGHVEIVRLLLDRYPGGAAVPSSKGKIAVHFAARWGHLQIVRELCRVFPDGVRAFDWERSLPLHEAAREGQIAMCRYLLERFPAALSTANLRGEIPLFPAVRSGSVDLVVLLVQAWPYGGKHILQRVSADDNVAEWNWELLALLLRGAVGGDMLRDSPLCRGREPPSIRLLLDDVRWCSCCCGESGSAADAASASTCCCSAGVDLLLPTTPPPRSEEEGQAPGKEKKKGKKKAKAEAMTHIVLAPRSNQYSRYPGPSASGFFSSSSSSSSNPGTLDDPSLARSKSPILLQDDQGNEKKRGAGDQKSAGNGKRMRFGYERGGAARSNATRTFIPLFAALECGASSHVIRDVIERRPEDVHAIDDMGRNALHWACQRTCGGSERLELIRQHFLSAQTAAVRDSSNRLPLHAAIMAKGSVEVIDALLDVQPTTAVEACRTNDEWHDKTPVFMACQCDCDVGTVYRLLRLDPCVFQRRFQREQQREFLERRRESN